MSWTPNQEYLDALVGMGINKAAAEQVSYTKYKNSHNIAYCLL